ncbi:hypothetical protein [Streptomyces leeuwenhoekii]|uniref:hypothetical protein n=1 Tax=Streptomyces leeuwenhoekii TaxID=1437453 RepID=UPI000A95E556|nr:hypothetical protein [Streptomyces leeuwenhoekii]
MARTGPQKIPGASQAYFYGTGRYSGSDMEVNCGVVHTTEGRSLPSYSGGAMAPTVTGVPDIKAKKIRWYQHYDVDESARALANKLGGVDTNTANAFQIELVGTCDAKKSTVWDGKRAGVDYIYWPGAPDWALAEVAWLVRWLHDYHGIPLTCVKDWLAYGKDARRPGVTPASYGASPARMSMSAWRSFKGWCGHQHVPENDHGDPGSMDFPRVIKLAKGDTDTKTPPAQQEDPMAGFTKKDVFDGAWNTDAIPAPASAPDAKTNRSWTASSYLRSIYNQNEALTKQVAGLTAAVGKLAQLAGSGVDTKQVVAAVEKAIAAAVIKVDVDITGADNA